MRIVKEHSLAWDDCVKHPVYQELSYTCTQINNGLYEPLAYEQLGNRCGLPSYIKLSSYLATSLKRGGNDLGTLLSQEASTALMEQKADILQQGQQAATKLMGPMMLLFLVILCLVMIPAFLSMNL